MKADIEQVIIQLRDMHKKMQDIITQLNSLQEQDKKKQELLSTYKESIEINRKKIEEMEKGLGL